MPRSRTDKESIINDIKERFDSATLAVLLDYRGVNVAEAMRLRRRLREAGCEFKVAKNTLTSLAVKHLNLEQLDAHLQGQIGIAFGPDPVTPAKILYEFIRETKKTEVKAGVLEGKIIDAASIRRLADLPSREVLLAMVMGGMKAPLYGLAGVLQGTISGFVYTLEALRKQRAGEA